MIAATAHAIPPDHPVQALSDTIRRVIHAETPAGLVMLGGQARVTVADGPLPPGVDASAVPADNLIILPPRPASMVRTAEKVIAGRRLNEAQQVNIGLLVHEHLHLTTNGFLALMGPVVWREVEEAAVDAVAMDLWPRVVRRITGRSITVDASGIEDAPYGTCTARIRRASAVAVGLNWRRPEAAAWRMRLVMAQPRERERMLRATGTNPADVCPLAKEGPRAAAR